MSHERMEEARTAKEQLAAMRVAHGQLRMRAAALEEDAAKAQREVEEAQRQTAPLNGQIA
jgi:hypothetical protein